LVYVSQMHIFLIPYLKGIHLTLESCRVNRDAAEGWGNPQDPDDGYMFNDCWDDMEDMDDVPEMVKNVPHLLSDLECLAELMSSETPHLLRDRPSQYIWVEWC
jgi:hypothetical protein